MKKSTVITGSCITTLLAVGVPSAMATGHLELRLPREDGQWLPPVVIHPEAHVDEATVYDQIPSLPFSHDAVTAEAVISLAENGGTICPELGDPNYDEVSFLVGSGDTEKGLCIIGDSARLVEHSDGNFAAVDLEYPTGPNELQPNLAEMFDGVSEDTCVDLQIRVGKLGNQALGSVDSNIGVSYQIPIKATFANDQGSVCNLSPYEIVEYANQTGEEEQ